MLIKKGNKTKLNTIFSMTYEELRKLASSVKMGFYNDTYNPTALVNEAYLKLLKTKNLEPTSKIHFKRIAARAMRQVLIDALRKRMTLKRGSEFKHVPLNEELDGNSNLQNLLVLDDELKELQRIHSRQGQIVELHFFGGYTIAEIARLLELSEATAWRDYRTAKAWLKVHIRRN